MALSFAFVLVVVATHPGAANDTSAALGIGGLVLTKNADIEMRSEDLYVSREEINVRYRFYNKSTSPVKIIVAFPLPDISLPSPDSEEYETPTIQTLDFVTHVNGQRVQTQIEKKAIANGADRTDILLRLGIPLSPRDAVERLNKLPRDVKDELIDLDLVRPLRIGTRESLTPNWILKTKYFWEQLFPRHSELAIDHRYKPVAGGTVPMSSDWLHRELLKPFYRSYCMDDDILSSLRETSYGQTWISYILTTGGNWSGPIGRFRLVVDKGSPSNLVSLCAEGVRKIDPTQFEVTATNFMPERDLSILILTPSYNSDASSSYSEDLSSYSCEQLWDRRNSLFRGAGYCFKTPRAIARFGNAGCSYDNQNDVPLSSEDKKLVEQIKSLELSRNCTR